MTKKRKEPDPPVDYSGVEKLRLYLAGGITAEDRAKHCGQVIEMSDQFCRRCGLANIRHFAIDMTRAIDGDRRRRQARKSTG